MFPVAPSRGRFDHGSMPGISRTTQKTLVLVAVIAAIVAGAALWLHLGLLGDLSADQRRHAWERFVIHLFCAAAVAQLLRAGLHGLELAGWVRILGPRVWFWLPVVIGPLLIFLREPLDVASGGPVAKSYLDLIGWALGLTGDRVAAGWLAERNWKARTGLLEMK